MYSFKGILGVLFVLLVSAITILGIAEYPTLLGIGIQLNRFARLNGGGGYAMFGMRILLGGSGFGYKVSAATARGQATLSMGGGFVNIGYLIVIKLIE